MVGSSGRTAAPSALMKYPTGNIDQVTVKGFGEEWSAYDQSALAGDEYDRLFDGYFGIFPFDTLPSDAEGFDLGCGSGRWAAGVAPRVGRLHCIDPSREALAVARRRLVGVGNVDFHLASADCIPLEDESQDFGYSIGVLHHIPDTSRAMADCVRKLKRGAPFLIYIYYNLDGRPAWFRFLWRISDVGRRAISRLPFTARMAVSSGIAALVYWPLAQLANAVERLGGDCTDVPLSAYRSLSFYSMRTDALDRFGTRLEQRFTRKQIEAMMSQAGLANLRFSEQEPFWVAVGNRQT